MALSTYREDNNNVAERPVRFSRTKVNTYINYPFIALYCKYMPYVSIRSYLLMNILVFLCFRVKFDLAIIRELYTVTVIIGY